jgi:hypothetical protein
MATITRLYDSYDDAKAAVRQLNGSGIPDSDISLVGNNADNIVDRDRDGADDRVEGASAGAGIGAAVGGTAGLLAGLGLIAIPGIGPVVAAGYLASTALGAVAGGATGGLIGALTQAGASEDEAHAYAEGVRRGGFLVTARVPDARRAELEAKLSGAVNIGERAQAYRAAGWQRFDPSGTGMTAEEIRRERQRYR